jgi:hypothetical protein
MAEPRITLIINGTTYSLCADNTEAIGNMPINDRRHLLTLLEAVRHKTEPMPAATPATRDASSSAAPLKPVTSDATARATPSDATPERMGSGDIDALMARLAVEDRRSRKPTVTRAGIYKATGGVLLFILLLVVIL